MTITDSSYSSAYPSIDPYETGFLDAGCAGDNQRHMIYWELSGNPDGVPIVFLHGGPGSGSSANKRQYFNPEIYKIIQFDQRGAGKSTPHACLINNTTQHLVSDMELLREYLNLDTWHVTGGSWGSTLALTYADSHPSRVNSLVMYGMFLCREQELKQLYCDGGIASQIYPDVFYPYLNLLPEADRADPMGGYYKLFTSDDSDLRNKALDVFSRLELTLCALQVDQDVITAMMADKEFVLSHSLMENHYMRNGGFIDGDALLKTLPKKIQHVPVHIVQGRYDLVCPFKTAWEIHNAIPHSHLHISPIAGHTAREPETHALLVKIYDLIAQTYRDYGDNLQASTDNVLEAVEG